MEKVKRLQFDFPPESYKRLEDLQGQMEVSTKAEVVRKALRLYELFATKVGRDNIVEIKDEENETVVYRMPVRTLLS